MQNQHQNIKKKASSWKIPYPYCLKIKRNRVYELFELLTFVELFCLKSNININQSKPELESPRHDDFARNAD